MNQKKLNVLMIIEQCNPDWASVPLVGYNFYQEVSKLADVTLVTHQRNQASLSKVVGNKIVFYVEESDFITRYYKLVSFISNLGRMNWPLYNTLTYPIYAEFNRKVYQRFSKDIGKGAYDVVHAITPMVPRYPFKIVEACQNTPFLLGPVNGGLPFPTGFTKIARQEFAYLNFLREIGKLLIPGYVETYKKADKILSGSTYTLEFLKKTFAITDERIALFSENGILKDYLTGKVKVKLGDRIKLLFIGRLVPYKGGDILIESIANLSTDIKEKIELTIVGDGSEMQNLQEQAKSLKVADKVRFIGWIKHGETLNFYRDADIFCFPSIREFGGAVVLEAMACGLPCIVVNNGGIGEYVTEETGFKIEPISREHIVFELAKKIEILIKDEALREQMTIQAVQRAREFEWTHKANQILSIYKELITQKSAN